MAATSLAWYDELRVPGAARRRPPRHGLRRGRRLGHHRRCPSAPGTAQTVGDAWLGPSRRGRLLDAWLAREATRVAIGLNTWEGVEYLDRDRLRDLLTWAVRLDAIDAPDERTAAASVRAAVRLAEAAEAAGYRVDRLRQELRAGPPKKAVAPKTTIGKTAGMTARNAATNPAKDPKTPTPRARRRKPRLPEQDPPKE